VVKSGTIWQIFFFKIFCCRLYLNYVAPPPLPSCRQLNTFQRLCSRKTLPLYSHLRLCRSERLATGIFRWETMIARNIQYVVADDSAIVSLTPVETHSCKENFHVRTHCSPAAARLERGPQQPAKQVSPGENLTAVKWPFICLRGLRNIF
jgi:hypothetical protein